MKAYLSSAIDGAIEAQIAVTGSKSESNRLLVLQALYPSLSIENVSESDDSVVLSTGVAMRSGTVDIHHAGTAMRFLTAYFSGQKGVEVILTGSSRMQERPIGILVDALRELGANIEYVNSEGFPPLRISGVVLKGSSVSLAATISSQYISALMLLAPSLENGLQIQLVGKITSVPYIQMTLSLLHRIGVNGTFSENRIAIDALENNKGTTVTVESDWSSASYFYSIVALSKQTKIKLTSYRKDSLQGDAALHQIYRGLGVQTTFDASEQAIILSKNSIKESSELNLDLSNTPDIAQTIAVTCFGLGRACRLTGLHTLKIKETDRLLALENELTKLGAEIQVTKDALQLWPSKEIRSDVSIDTYHDHRMAMAFAPLGLLTTIGINDCRVVSKSFPSFWEDLSKVGMAVQFENA